MSTRPIPVSTTQHAIRQLKLVVPGGAITYYLGTFQEFWWIVQGANGSLGRCVNFSISSWHSMSDSLFLAYICIAIMKQHCSSRGSRTWTHNRCLVHLLAHVAVDNRGRAQCTSHSAFFRLFFNFAWIVSFMERIRHVVISDTCEFCPWQIIRTLCRIMHQAHSARNLQVLTLTIVVGWLLFVLTLGQWSNLGYGKGVIGGQYGRPPSFGPSFSHFVLVCAVYALIFGVLGLLPVPKLKRR